MTKRRAVIVKVDDSDVQAAVMQGIKLVRSKGVIVVFDYQKAVASAPAQETPPQPLID